MASLDEKTIIVTGAVSGFGRGIVAQLLSRDARVVGIDLKKPDNDESPAKLPGRYHLLTGDVTSEQTWHGALQAAQEHFSSIPDTIVNCAGFVYLGQAPESVPLEDFDRLWQINVKPLYLGVKHIVPHWISNHISGHFITIGSISSQRPRPSTVWYGASKGALDTATEGLAAAYAKDGIRFNIVRPSIGNTAMLSRVQGGVDTEEGRAKRLNTIPLGRLCEPQDVAQMVAFLASDEANYIT
ncbi:hypothetical protein N7474_010467 [Penicillium riverlandense]|uniref:uncharacterized protein n=1 Tax=Penicillium riverlandense TaxID=1903569 RepID=UPI002547E743|nr:uncharacterized protein N7474_010467 [Penicillium riverlandense]KAJ5806875.1 hypothetical protein N7474_010467 [Penicillium riverlandense]